MNLVRNLHAGIIIAILATTTAAQIPHPQDAPKPLSPAESRTRFAVPEGFRIELVASEPLIREPSGVCWDERGQLFVCELHGYNLEGQYDIEELNKTGQLDREVRRIQADERFKQAAEAETYGTIRQLFDTNGDGRMDQAKIWADRLPPCLGICPARGGIVAACKTQILFLADRDGDGTAEVRDVLFKGFAKGPLERSINCPQWGPDNWIYVGRGRAGGTISGKSLSRPVQLPGTDFRIQPDGSAIEPVVGGTGTMGFAFTEAGDRFVVSTRTPGIFVAPLPWHYLARNPDMVTPSLEQNGTDNQRVYPASKPHPWRSRRAKDPGFSKYYSDRYGIQESAPNGYFTSACSPLVYRDNALPGLRGQLLACEPAQNMVHRELVERNGVRLTLHRPPGEEMAEFLTSSDPWFHPIFLAHAPDGSVFIVDFYREIIEDYSAIPRYLQQQYGLINGQDRGRIWRLTHESAKHPDVPSDMSQLNVEQLATAVGSSHFWRRQTARRLLIERQAKETAALLSRMARESSEPFAVMNALQTLEGLEGIESDDLLHGLSHADAGVRRMSLQLAEHRFDKDAAIFEKAVSLTSDPEPMVRLQSALSLGERHDERALLPLARLARTDGDDSWMRTAILSSVPNRGGNLLAALLEAPDELGNAAPLLEPLCSAIANRRNRAELSQMIILISSLEQSPLQAVCLHAINSALQKGGQVDLSGPARTAVKKLGKSPAPDVRNEALSLLRLPGLETPAEREKRVARATADLSNIQSSTETQLAAVTQLGGERDPKVTAVLLGALPSSTPRVRVAILDSILSRTDRLSSLLDAIESKTLPASFLNAVQRATLLEAKDPDVRKRAALLLASTTEINQEQFDSYMQALKNQRDVAHGRVVFEKTCGNCHRAHGLGHTVGPDLSAEFRRAEETVVRDVLVPGEKISAGYVTYAVVTTDGRVFNGLLSAESPTSITLRQAEGKEQVILRRDVEEMKAMSISMMPDDLTKKVPPKDLADALAWLQQPPTSLVLLDENVELVEALREGRGTVQFIVTDRYAGQSCLQITPPQRYSPRIAGWKFPIRENPGPGEFRYLRFAWKSPGGHGVMLELAADGQWPPAGQPIRRYHAGKNATSWQSVEVSPDSPEKWTTVTRDLWKDFGNFTLTGFAPTAMGGAALFDRMELLQTLEEK